MASRSQGHLSRSHSKILAGAASGIGEFIRRQGADPHQVFHDAGVEEKLLDNPKIPLNLACYVQMMESAARRTRNDNFGLHYGQQFKPRMLGLIGEITLASPTLGAAIANLATLFPYYQQATQTRLIQESKLFRLEYRIIDGQIIDRRQDAELSLGMLINIFRYCLGPSWAPTAVLCEHVKPMSWREHEHMYGAPVYFGQQTNAIVFRPQDLSHRMPQANLNLFSELRRELIGVNGNVGSVSFVDTLKSAIRSDLPTRTLTMAGIAQTMSLPRWTFQRRLAECGLSYSGLVDLVRRDLAGIYIRQAHVPVTDIACVLGYSELSALSRAFKRWYGMSPEQFRLRASN